MIEEFQPSIPDITIEDFRNEDQQILLMELEDFNLRYREVITNPHRLTFYQIILVTKGQLTCSIDSHNYTCPASSIIALSKGQIQKLSFDDKTTGSIILFSEEYINRYPEDLKWINNLELFHPLTDPLMIGLANNEYEEIETYCEKIKVELLKKNDFAKEGIIINLLKATILTLERINRDKFNVHTKDINEWTYFTKFRDHLEEQFKNSRSVQHYADLLNTSSRKLNEITYNYSGKPAKRLIEDRVLLEAKRLLIYTDDTIKEIGHFIGFSDPTNFNKFFKKFVNITPAEFRDLNKTSI